MAETTTQPDRGPVYWLRITTIAGLSTLVLAYLAIWLLAPIDFEQLGGFWPFTGVGLMGALIANSTGVGGGVVFVPAFSMLRETGTLDISPAEAVGISFAIQCFGMSVGSLTWLNRFYRRDADPVEASHRPLLWSIIALSLTAGLPTMLFTQHGLNVDADLAFLAFKLFSISLGAMLLLQLFTSSYLGGDRVVLSTADRIGVVLVGLAGGAATALFSVGLGELLALYLFLRRFPVDVCVSTAVVGSAISVLTGVVFHLNAGNVVWEILIFAAPAVMLGGFLARRLAHWLGAYRLKLGVALWIILSSSALLLMG